jgi:site-specific DNA-methyltransferase (adenine-specific)
MSSTTSKTVSTKTLKRLYKGDCLTGLTKLADNSVDSIVTDPPYELGIYGKSWDRTGIAYNVEMWQQCVRVLKPSGALISFGGSRTYHRMATAVEDAGFEIRDQLLWVYAEAMPKLNNLKPAHEPMVLARKPFSGTIAASVKEWGTGTLNIDQCRVPREEGDVSYGGYGNAEIGFGGGNGRDVKWVASTTDRWPANFIHDGSGEVLANLPKGAGRYFYCAKPSKAERTAGLSKGQGVEARHPCQKPLTLLSYLISLVTPEGGCVLDPFLGSGSTAVAAVLGGYEWRGCEMTSEYYSQISKRVKKAEAAFALVHKNEAQST